MSKAIVFFNLISITICLNVSCAQNTQSNKVIEDSTIKYDSINVKELSFNNRAIQLYMKLDTFFVNYPDYKIRKILIMDDGEEYEVNRYFFSSRSNIGRGVINEGEPSQYFIVRSVFIEDDKSSVDQCEEARVGKSIDVLAHCFPNSYKLDIAPKLKVLDTEKGKYRKREEMLSVIINYKGQEEWPLSLIYWWDTETRKIIKIETRYQDE